VRLPRASCTMRMRRNPHHAVVGVHSCLGDARVPLQLPGLDDSCPGCAVCRWFVMKEGHIFWFKTDQVTEVSTATPALSLAAMPLSSA
jgi:hypothetical protein